MKKITKFLRIGFYKLNNAEFGNFCRRSISNMLDAGIAKLGVPPAKFNPFNANNTLLEDIISQSRTSDQSARIIEADAKCDDILRYMLGLFDRGRFSPNEADRAAYTSLYNLTKPYHGIMRLPRGQQIQQTRGLIHDVSKEGNSDHIIHLKLVTLVQALNDANTEYAMLIDDRAEHQVATDLPPCEEVRAEMGEQYDEIITLIAAKQMTDPTPEGENFIAVQEKLIADTNTAYNQRMAQIHYHKNKDKEEGAGEDGGEGTGGDETEA